MLPIALVFLFAQSAFAAPSVGVEVVPINSVLPIPENGQLVSSSIIDRSFDYIDGGDLPLYVHMFKEIINNMADVPDDSTKASALMQSIVTIGELANGIPGDSCEAAALINAYAYSTSTGNSAGLRSALPNYIQHVAGCVDTIVKLVVNPSSVRSAGGSRGRCLGGGRSYQFEEAWDAILERANAYQIGLLNEEYCASKRLYNAFSIRSNNVAAAITAATIGPVNQIAISTMGPMAQFFRAVANGKNPAVAGAIVKNALLQSLSNVKY